MKTLTGSNRAIKNHLIPPGYQKLILSNTLLHFNQKARLDAETFLWKNLQEAFPDELKEPLSTLEVKVFMERRKIAMMDLSSPGNLLKAIAESDITEIFFTGSFSPVSVFCRFYESMLEQQVTRTIRQQRGVLLNASYFGRPVWLTVLYSASGNANVGISRSQQFRAIRHQLDENRPVHDFRIRSYREKFELPA